MHKILMHINNIENYVVINLFFNGEDINKNKNFLSFTRQSN